MLKPTHRTFALALTLVCAAACGPEKELAPDVMELTIQSIADTDEDFVADAMGWDTFDALPLLPEDVLVYAGYVDADGVAQLRLGPAPRAVDDKTLSATVTLGAPPPEVVVDGSALAFIVVIDQALPASGDLVELAGDVRLDVRSPLYRVGGDDEGLERIGWERAFMGPAADGQYGGRFALRSDP